MEKTIIKFGDFESKKQELDQYKRPISIKNTDIDKIVVCNKASSLKKGCKDAKIRPLCIFLPKMSAYRRDFDVTKYIFLLIKDDKLLEKYNEIQEKVSMIIKKELNCETADDEKYLKTKTNSYQGKINTNFHNDKIPKEDSHCICYQ